MTQTNTALVITSISSPSPILEGLAKGARDREIPFYLIGDVPSPDNFQLDGCDFYSLERQRKTGFLSSTQCPTRHYARKNIGYLLAASRGAKVIIETDDDNAPRETFWGERARNQSVPAVHDAEWVNAYAYFTDTRMWPRGLPLDAIQKLAPSFEGLPHEAADCPIQQGLADGNPDVDAIYRLVFPLPASFRTDRRVALGSGSWCPFNSQNTTWWADAFPLLYLPAYCSFRMTDIWRSFVAQRIAWANGWSILFTEPTVWQERNEHDLLRDFRDEVPGYLNNRRICEELQALAIAPGTQNLYDNLRLCYEALVRLGVVERDELALLEAWISDISSVQKDDRSASAVSAS